jgi:uncharacterized protein
MFMRFILLNICLVIVTWANAQQAKKLPIIDMHLHALHAEDQGPPPLTMGAPFAHWGCHDPKQPYMQTIMQVLKSGEWAATPISSPTTDSALMLQTIAMLNKYNVYAVTSGEPHMVRQWKKASPMRIINSVYWNHYDIQRVGLTKDSLLQLFQSGEFKVFGELGLQYEGISLSDSIMEPFLAMAEKLDIPVGVHVGPGPPGVIYMGATQYRARLHSATQLEEALVRHPKLRVYAMHAGWPMLDDMLATLYAHPQLYVDLGVIAYAVPKKEFYFYLERLVNAGFEKRILFGSDNMVWPESIGIAIDNINAAPFLSPSQKRDILFNNAARFLRLTKEEISQMHQ